MIFYFYNSKFFTFITNMVAAIYDQQNNDNQQNNNDNNQQEVEISPSEMLDLLRSHRLDEILDNFSSLTESFIEYLPDQFFGMSQTMRNIARLRNLSNQELDKLADIFEMAVIFSDFGCFYKLEPEYNEHVIADIILDFDTAFWNNQNNNVYENMVDEFKNMYGYIRVDNIMAVDY